MAAQSNAVAVSSFDLFSLFSTSSSSPPRPFEHSFSTRDLALTLFSALSNSSPSNSGSFRSPETDSNNKH